MSEGEQNLQFFFLGKMAYRTRPVRCFTFHDPPVVRYTTTTTTTGAGAAAPAWWRGQWGCNGDPRDGPAPAGLWMFQHGRFCVRVLWGV